MNIHIFCLLALVAIVAFELGRRWCIYKSKPLGKLLILVDEVDGTRYPLVELNNDHDLWNLKTGEVAVFVIKKKD